MAPFADLCVTRCIFSPVLFTFLFNKDKNCEDAIHHWLPFDCDAFPSDADAGVFDCAAAVFLAPVGFSLCISAAQGGTCRGLKGLTIVT